MSEEKCESCGRAVPYDEIEYGWCPECIDEVTHDTDLILEYICDYRNNYGGNNYKHDFFVNYCHNANDTEFSSTLTLVCKKHFLYMLETGSNEAKCLLTEYVNESLTDYLDWVRKKDYFEKLSAKKAFDESVRDAVIAIYRDDRATKELIAKIDEVMKSRGQADAQK